jgi:hypothetical protein
MGGIGANRTENGCFFSDISVRHIFGDPVQLARNAAWAEPTEWLTGIERSSGRQ